MLAAGLGGQGASRRKRRGSRGKGGRDEPRALRTRAGECGGLLDRSGMMTDGGVPMPSGGKESARVTLCPQNHEFPWHGGVRLGRGEGSKGHSQQGDTPGQREGGKTGKLEGEKAQKACQKPAIQVGLGLLPSLPPCSPGACCLPAGRESRRPGGAGSCPCGGQGTRKGKHFPPPGSQLNNSAGREQGDALL